MNNFEYESFPEGEWDDRGDLIWNEFDWERFIRSQDDILRRYQELYQDCLGHPDRLDRVALLMGWETDDWTGWEDEADENAEEFDDDADPDEDGEWDADPYTMQKHPVFIASKALYIWLQGKLIELTCAHPSISSGLATQYQATLHLGENNCVSGIQALDMGDYALAVCFFKRALADVNRSLSFLDRLARAYPAIIESYREEASRRIFDLREIWLRVMQYSREELDRGIRDGE